MSLGGRIIGDFCVLNLSAFQFSKNGCVFLLKEKSILKGELGENVPPALPESKLTEGERAFEFCIFRDGGISLGFCLS